MAAPAPMPADTPSTKELVTLGARVVLRDGSRVRIRQGHRSDRRLLVEGFGRLSPESRYRRFLTAMPELSSEMVRYLTEIDHHAHEAMVALDADTGDGVGVARYFRLRDRPEAAEVAVTVTDAWQGRGLGTLLLEVLSARAREEGVRTFTALMLATNREMMDVIATLGPVRVVDREAGSVEIEVPIPAVGLAPPLRKLLRIAAHGSRSGAVPTRDVVGSPGASQLPAPTDPGVTVSSHRALLTSPSVVADQSPVNERPAARSTIDQGV